MIYWKWYLINFWRMIRGREPLGEPPKSTKDALYSGMLSGLGMGIATFGVPAYIFCAIFMLCTDHPYLAGIFALYSFITIMCLFMRVPDRLLQDPEKQ